jgi:hypothetical protein
VRIHATSDQDWAELETILTGMNLLLRAVRESLEPAGPPRPTLTLVEGSRRTARSTRRKPPALRVVAPE